MAIRVRNRFHTAGQRSMATLASVVALTAWKLALESIKRMRRADFDIDIGQTYFDFVCEFLAFLTHAADRVAYARLSPEQRVEFTTALVKRLAGHVEESSEALLGPGESERCRRQFLDVFNRCGEGYSEFGYDADGEGPDFGFRRYFGACLREILPQKDQLWVIDQAMDIEAPDAIEALHKTMKGLFAPPGEDRPRRSREGVSGD